MSGGTPPDREGLANEDAALLQSVTAALSGAHDVAAVVAVVTGLVREGLGAEGALLARLEDTGFRLLGAVGLPPEAVSRVAMLPREGDRPTAEALRTRAPVIVSTRDERARRFPDTEPPMDPGSFACVPMLLDSVVVGVVCFLWTEEYAAAASTAAQLLALAAQCGQALERARLYDAEQLARRAAEAAVESLRGLQSLTAALSRAVDGKAVAAAILDVTMRLLQSTGGAVFRVDEATETLQLMGCRGLREVELTPVLPLQGNSPAAMVVRTGQTVAPPETPQARAASGGRRIAEAPVWSPLLHQGRVVGVMAMRGHDRDTMLEMDPVFVSTVNLLCAQALERAQLYDTNADIALTLQRSLLPHRPPAIPGLEVAVRYRPVGGRTVVGGDFYDVFRVGPGRWGVVIGDVSGKGIPAAALTALARYTVRAVAAAAAVPSDVLAALNAAVLDRDDGADRFCTAAYLDVEPGPHGAAIRLTVGGHPLPVVRDVDGVVRAVGSPGMALGLLPLAEVNDTELTLAPGEVLVLVTDGVTEARRPTGEWVEDAVERALAADGPAEGGDAEAIADRIERIVLDVQDGRPRDDLAVVVLRAPTDRPMPGAVTMSLTLECEPSSVAVARRRVTELVRERGEDEAAEILELLVSEAVTNAVVHAGTAVGVRIAIAADRAHVEVTDGSSLSPVRRNARLDSLGGRGLLLLDRLAARWGVRRVDGGKVVWFDVDLAPAAVDS